MPNVSFADDIDSWGRLIRAVENNAADLPHLEAQRQELRELHDRALALRSRQMVLESKLRRATEELREAIGRGRDLSSRIRSGFKQVYGAHSVKLIEAGSRPRRRPRKKGKQGEGEPAAEAGQAPEGMPS